MAKTETQQTLYYRTKKNPKKTKPAHQANGMDQRQHSWPPQNRIIYEYFRCNSEWLIRQTFNKEPGFQNQLDTVAQPFNGKMDIPVICRSCEVHWHIGYCCTLLEYNLAIHKSKWLYLQPICKNQEIFQFLLQQSANYSSSDSNSNK